MKRKQAPKDQPERRRPLAEINLVGQKGSRPAAGGGRRRGCAQIFGVLSVVGAAAICFGLTIGPR